MPQSLGVVSIWRTGSMLRGIVNVCTPLYMALQRLGRATTSTSFILGPVGRDGRSLSGHIELRLRLVKQQEGKEVACAKSQQDSLCAEDFGVSAGRSHGWRRFSVEALKINEQKRQNLTRAE